MAYNLPPKTLPRFEVLKRNARNIRLHGNRFIQMDVGPGVRFHVWSDLVPRGQVRPAPIHNHDYDFNSRVLSGQLINVVYKPTFTKPTPEVTVLPDEVFHDIYVVDRGPGILVKTDVSVALEVAGVNVYSKNHGYRMSAPMIHASSYVGHAITCLMQGQSHRGPAQVFVPNGIMPDNKYRRDDYSEASLWEIVAEVYSSIVLTPETEQQMQIRDWDLKFNGID